MKRKFKVSAHMQIDENVIVFNLLPNISFAFYKYDCSPDIEKQYCLAFDLFFWYIELRLELKNFEDE